MKDRAFTGRDVAEAVRTAALTLGIPEDRLRYFVLEPGRPGGLGVTPTGARIAVLVDTVPARDEPGARPMSRRDEPGPADLPGEAEEGLEDRLGRVMGALSEAAGIALEGRVDEDREAVTLRLRSSDPGFYLGPEGDDAPLRALEHLLHRMFAPDVHPLKLRVELEGYREARDEALRALALRLVEEIKRSGQPGATEPLNAYERRIVHLAVAAAGGVVSQSEGEGTERRVVVRRTEDPGPGGEVH